MNIIIKQSIDAIKSLFPLQWRIRLGEVSWLKPVIKLLEQRNSNIYRPRSDTRFQYQINSDAAPLISVVMATYKPDLRFLKKAVKSVLKQRYSNWQLCIVDDGSNDPSLAKYLTSLPEKDKRIKVKINQRNQHISLASNDAVSLTDGGYLAFLDHDDELHREALHCVASKLSYEPGIKIIYTDEDKIDSKNKHFSPHYKSDWNQFLFYSQNYLSHLTVLDSNLFNTIGGFRKGFEGSQDYDLLLRCLQKIDESQIAHIPEVLYHWRAIKGSTALDEGQKGYAAEAGLKSLSEHIARVCPSANVEHGDLPTTYKVNWPSPVSPPSVAIIIPTRDKKQLLESCINSILNLTDYGNYKIYVIDNNSQDSEAIRYLTKLHNENNKINVTHDSREFNYSALNNAAVGSIKEEFVLLLNNDIEVISSNWLTEMVSCALQPNIGCVGAKLYYPDGRIQHAGVIIGLGGVAGHSHKYADRNNKGYFGRLVLRQNLSAVTAACMLVRRELYIQVGGFDEQHLKVAFNDVDFCLKLLMAGYKNVWTPFAELCHHESVSRGQDICDEKRARFQSEVFFMKNKWTEVLKMDPYYNPNLTLDSEDFGYAR